MSKLPSFTDENLLVGVATSDDAAVYKLSDDSALIQTVDFFTPVVDDPYLFGQIAAANSLSDVYAMGGTPKIALNLVGFPGCLDPSILGDIMAGGADKVKEAGAILIGGHSIQNDEPLYGLCVSGFVHPQRIWKNYGARPGDALILTKQLGSGVVNTAVKGDIASEAAAHEAAVVMSSLNRKAKEALEALPVHACTDITGFGLMGHAVEMAEASDVTLVLEGASIPLIGEAMDYAAMGLVPAGAYRNRGYFGDKLDPGGADEALTDLLFDPQTSGGLLVSLPGELAREAMERLEDAGLDTRAAVIGHVTEKGEKLIRLT